MIISVSNKDLIHRSGIAVKTHSKRVLCKLVQKNGSKLKLQ